MVHLQNFHERHVDEGLFVFAIAMEPDREKARGWNRRLGVTYTVFDGHGSALGQKHKR